MAKSVYIHIPFCKSKCKYCSFVSFLEFDKKRDYIFSLLKEIDSNYNGEKIKTLYFGGGTPSLLKIDCLKKIINKFNLEPDCEITFELNPDDANLDYLSSLREIGINRLSMGAQTFDDEILKLIGRRHNAEQIINGVKFAKKSGFENISLDLIYGLPCQSIESLQKDLDTIISLQIQHVSTYGLKIEEGSHFYSYLPKNLPDDDLQADMYLFVNEKLESSGYKRYEVSNFSLQGYESKHNLNYWNNQEYYGFGIAAHGYINGIRYSNFNTLEEYIKNPTIHDFTHLLSEKEKLEEEIFLGFRKECGIDIIKINSLYGIDFEDKYQKVLKKFTPQYIVQTPVGYKLTLEGVMLSNNVLCEFIGEK